MAGHLQSHLESGATTICRAWKLVRRDAVTLGFTDHDCDLTLDGTVFAARTGLSARALQQATGLSVDNSEAMGALSDAAVREEDIVAGRFDDAAVTAYLVNWQDPRDHVVLFHGTIGEISRENGAFRAELRGLTERLNLTQGRVYQPGCSACLGDERCGLDLDVPGMKVSAIVAHVRDRRHFEFTLEGAAPKAWFDHGILRVVSGAAAGLEREIRQDIVLPEGRGIVLWRAIIPDLEPGDRVELTAGCDRRARTCQSKFGNMLNFRGFPDVPGDDWLRRPPEEKTARRSGSFFG